MNYIYLDWNVIQYMKHQTKTNSIDGKAFYDLVKKLSKRYVFPVSEGHLKDLAAGSTKTSRNIISQDLNFLKDISDGFVLGVDPNESLIPTNQVDIVTFFDSVANKQDGEPSFNVIGDTYQVDMVSLPKDDLLRPFLESNNGILDASVMQNFLANIWQLRDDPNFYKEFRNGVAKLKEKFIKTDTILNQESDSFNKIIPFLDFLGIDDENVLERKFDETLKAFLAIGGRNINNMKTGEKIQVAYMLLDFHPRFRDKVNKKNRPSNIGRDLKNFFFASQAKYYVTEDKATLKKAAFVSKYLSLKVKVENMSKFFSRFC